MISGAVFVILLLLFMLFEMATGLDGHSRETRNRMRCANNLRKIGLEAVRYCDDNQQQYPSKLGMLITAHQRLSGLGADGFVCPSSSDTELQVPPAQQADTLLSGGHCSYVYVGAGMTSSAGANDVVAFELPDNHGREGGNVVYGDAHVSWERFDGLVQLVSDLEAGRNPPVIGVLTAKQAKTIYEQKWVPRLASIKDGSWAGSLPRPSPATRPSEEAK